MHSEAIGLLEEKLAETEAILSRQVPAVDGELGVTRDGKRLRFFRCLPSGREYLGRKQEKEIALLAQKKYELALKKAALRDCNRLRCALSILSEIGSPRQVFDCMPEAVKPLLTPYGGRDEDYVKAWLKANGKQTPEDKYHVFETLKGDFVRSKSEVIIADRLWQSAVPYVYESELDFGEDGRYYPDFLALNKRTRSVFWWEHLGWLDDDRYGLKTIRKLCTYAEHGITLSKNLLLTYETEECRFDTGSIDRLINRFLL